jgi:uncharacterized protein (TIGR03437 family)
MTRTAWSFTSVLLFTLTGVLHAQGPTVSAVLNSASFSTNLCPGVLAAIYGSNFGSDASMVSVQVAGKFSYIASVSPTQINALLPYDAATGSNVPLVVSVIGHPSAAAFPITLNQYAPGITTASQTGSGVGQFATSTALITAKAPATAGETIALYAVGLGAVTPAIPTGLTPKSPVEPAATKPTLTVGGKPATVAFAGLVPGLAGLYQVNFTVPATAQGNADVVLSVGGQSSNTVTLPLVGITAVVNGASFLNTGTAAPGSFVSVFANGLASLKDQLFTFPSTTVEGVTVTFNGTPAPIASLSAAQGQINLVVPNELPTSGSVNVQITTPAGMAPNLPLLMAPAVPGVFRVTDPANTALINAAAQFANTVWLAIPTSAASDFQIPINCTTSMANPLVLCGQPAAPGDTLILYATGLGAATPNGDPSGQGLATGTVAPASGSPLYETVATPTVMVGGVPATVVFSGLAPGDAGVYQIDFTVPTGVTEGDTVPLAVSMPGSTTDSSTTIAVHSR